jgi:hypothetical protein
MSVNKPVDEQKKDADIARKLQVYGILAGFQSGKLPSNDQIDVALNSFLATKGISSPHERLSDDGKTLVADFREVIRRANHLIQSKNAGNLLQDFIWQTKQFDTKQVSGVNTPVNKDTAKRDGQEALDGLRTLGTLIITNGQFRKLLNDSTILFRDMVGDAASHAASRVRPSEDQLAQVDSPADDNTWHEAPNLSKDHLKKQAGRVYGGDAKKDIRDVAHAGVGGAKSDDASGRANAGNAVQQKLDQNVDDETKDKVRARNEELRNRTREYLRRKMPQERKDQTIWRLKKMVLECQQHPEYTHAIQTLLDIAERYGGHGKSLGRDATGTAKDTRSVFGVVETDLKTLIERFANGTSTDDLWTSINQIYKDADQDSELRDWFGALNSYIRRCLLEQGYILDDESTHQWNQLYDEGRYLLRDKYRTHTDRVLNEIKFLGDQMDHDPLNQAFKQSLQKFYFDLGHDASGNATFKPHLLKDIIDVIGPSILENISYVPIPRVEYSDPQIDAVVENVVIESDNFMPNVAEIYGENYFRFGRKNASSSYRQTFELTVKGVQVDMRKVSYYIRRKKGFPTITDKGLVDIQLPGNGFGFKVRMTSASNTKGAGDHKFFKIEKVDVDIKSLRLKIIQSDHKLLLSLLKPLVLHMMRPILTAAVGKSIKDQANRLDELLWRIKQDADEAAQRVVEDPNEAPTVYARWVKAAQDNITKGKAKAKDAASDKKINLAMTKEDSIFPDVNLPGGISTKATEYRQQAREGEKWQSPVFSIGSAGRSTDVPSTPRITRKSHGLLSPNPQGNGNGFSTPTGNGYSTAPATGYNMTTGYTPGTGPIDEGVGGVAGAMRGGVVNTRGLARTQETVL